MLRRAVGARYVSSDVSSLKRYAEGSPPSLRNVTYRWRLESRYLPQALPGVIVRPSSTEQVSQVMQIANTHNVPVVPWGGGSNLVGATVAKGGWIVLDMNRLNRIKKVDDRHLCVVVEPAVKLARLQRVLGKYGLRHHTMAGSALWATVGGAIASDAHTNSFFRYGTVAKEILELEFVTPAGVIIRTGAWRGAGLDLKGLLPRSEGTLGVITAATIRIHRVPPFRRQMCFAFDTFSEAMEANHQLWFGEHSAVSTIISFDRAERYPEFNPVGHGYDGWLALTLEGTRAGVSNGMSVATRVVRAHGGLPLRQKLVDSFDDWWTVFGRANLEAVRTGKVDKKTWRFAPNVWVPPGKVIKIREVFKESAVRHGLLYGGCSYRPTRITLGLQCDMSDDAQVENAGNALRDLKAAVHDAGGTLAGAHGAGLSYKEEVNEVLGDATIKLMKRIKAALDPNGIMNPGKIFD
ncbi:MAG: FAD-binding oxidoreductase [Thaumarchaeota archaeon]|nr:FAD-binding oxidoreductase [Nitrososphaerota archaeon]